MTDPSPDSPRARLIAAYLEKRPELVRFFTARLRSAASAEDLVQDIYLRLDRLEADVEVQSEGAYLYRLGMNLMLDRIRGERRTADRDSQWQDLRRVVDQGEDAADEPSPEDAYAGRQRLEQVLAAVAVLPPKCAQAFRLHKLQGLSHPEVAQAMGISRSAVEKHVSAALKHLLLRLP